MLSENEIIRYGEQVEKIFIDLQNEIIDDIVRRLKKAGELTATANYQIQQLRKLGLTDTEIQNRIRKALEDSQKVIESVYYEAAEKVYNANKALYLSSGLSFVPLKENTFMLNLIRQTTWQTMGEMYNFTGTTGFIKNDRFYTITDYFIITMDSALMKIQSGAFDYNTVLRQTVAELVNSGIRWVDYSSGHHNRLNVSVRRAVMTGMRQMSQGITLNNAEELKTETFEVSAHPNARPEHAVWQGKVYKKNELVTKCGLGTGQGLMGWNCYHLYYPFIKGVSKRNYTTKQLNEWKKTSTEKTIRWNGKKFSGYEATQQMRQLESAMRLQRERIHLLKLGGADEQTIRNSRARYNVNRAKYKELAKILKVPTEWERIYIDNLGRV